MATNQKKLYANSWAAPLTLEQRWEVYEKALTCRAWDQVAAWAAKEYKLEKMPSRAAWFRWMKIMQKGQYEYKMMQAARTSEGILGICKKYNVTDEEAIRALLAEACSLAIERNDSRGAVQLVNAAMGMRNANTDRDKFEELKRKNEVLEARENDAKQTMQAKLSPEEREAKLKEIFGVR